MSSSSSSSSSGASAKVKKLCAKGKVREQFLNDLTEFLRKTPSCTRTDQLTPDLRKRFLKAKEEGWVHYQLRVRNGRGCWVTPGMPEVSTEDNVKRAKKELQRKRKIVMNYQREIVKRAKLKRAELAEIMEQANKVKAELSLLRAEEANHKMRHEIIANSDEVIRNFEDVQSVQGEVDKLKSETAKVKEQIDELKAKVAAQGLLTLN